MAQQRRQIPYQHTCLDQYLSTQVRARCDVDMLLDPGVMVNCAACIEDDIGANHCAWVDDDAGANDGTISYHYVVSDRGAVTGCCKMLAPCQQSIVDCTPDRVVADSDDDRCVRKSRTLVDAAQYGNTEGRCPQSA